MMRGMYAAVSGLEAHQTMLDVTANNLANVDTIGYKAQRASFVDELSQMLRPASGTTATAGGTNPVQVGLGVQVGSIDNMMGAGSLESTGNATDVAIQGNGFLRVAQGDPTSMGTATNLSLQYTRAGDLTFTPYNATTSYLTTQSGQYVLGYAANADGTINTAGGANNPISVPTGATNVAIAQNGAVTYQNASGTTVTAGYISLSTFPNQAGLQRDGGSLWSANANSGAEVVGQPDTSGFGQTISGELEMSNVDMATEFTNMIEAQRGYQANSSVITTADQMLQTVVQMKQ
jgi:flagellar hook protein FlgE